MLFNSWQFLIFFPVVTILYFLFPHNKRWLLLLAASSIFYMAFIPQYLLILFFLIVVDYTAGRLIQSSTHKNKKLFLIFSIFTTILILASFKYFNFITSNIIILFSALGLHYQLPNVSLILPLGLSFHTFQSLAYVIEVYRGRYKAEKNFGIYALYVMFYPQLVAGPIERPYNLLPQFYEKHKFVLPRVLDGLKLMLWGFFKKIVIADSLAIVVNQAYGAPAESSGLFLLLATYFFALQIFCDFSGYSDIAIGAAQVMGFNLMDNFNRPYLAKSVAQFWTRWHISLSTWFRDYLYIPLGGSRTSKVHWSFNIVGVFLVSGLWHGANWKFVIWGGLLGIMIVVSKILGELKERFLSGLHFQNKITDFLAIGLTFNLVSFTWIFFRASSVSDALFIIQKIASDLFTLVHNIFNLDFSLLTRIFSTLFINNENLLIALFFVIFMEIIYLFEKHEKMRHFFNDKPVFARWALYYFIILAIVFFGHFNEVKFIYFQF